MCWRYTKSLSELSQFLPCWCYMHFNFGYNRSICVGGIRNRKTTKSILLWWIESINLVWCTKFHKFICFSAFWTFVGKVLEGVGRYDPYSNLLQYRRKHYTVQNFKSISHSLLELSLAPTKQTDRRKLLELLRLY